MHIWSSDYVLPGRLQRESHIHNTLLDLFHHPVPPNTRPRSTSPLFSSRVFLTSALLSHMLVETMSTS